MERRGKPVFYNKYYYKVNQGRIKGPIIYTYIINTGRIELDIIRDKSKEIYYNYRKKGYYTREYKSLKK